MNTLNISKAGRARRFLTGLAIACGLAAGTVQAGLPFSEFVDPNPSASNGFGTHIVPLSTGNVVITSPYADVGGTDTGAVYLFNGATGALISTLTGSTTYDQVGSGGVIALTNGNYVVISSLWNNGATALVGAATWGNGTTGVAGTVSAANSLIGASANDQVSASGVTALTNGNYVVRSNSWKNGAAVTVGAVTWGNGATGTTGTVSAANSLIGSTASDGVGSGGVTALSNGNYVVSSPYWNNGATADVGAATWGNGATGTTGTVSTSNSLVGSRANDQVGIGVVALTNGNYVVNSYNWDASATVADVGATTWGNGASGTTGTVGSTNSLVGVRANDGAGASVIALTNGNYVVHNPNWDNGATADVSAATWGNGSTSGTRLVGTISSSNSLVGSTASDGTSVRVIALTNGNYVVSSPYWNNGATADVGAVTWCSGTTGRTGAVSTANSLIGSVSSDNVGGFNGVIALTNGNYVVSSPYWNNGVTADVGAVTWGNGSTGTTGTVSAANSLIGSTASDIVSGSGVTALTNGNYVVRSPSWDNGTTANVGAATWGNGATGTTGTVSAANSLIGSTANDNVGVEVVALTNGNYVVCSSNWDNGTTVNVGAVTWGDGSTGVTGTVSTSNSLVGSAINDAVGVSSSNYVIALNTGNYLVISPVWGGDTSTNIGAATFGDGASGTVGTVLTTNSSLGLVAVTVSGPAAVSHRGLDNVNNTFFYRFISDGKIRIGSQVNGFPAAPSIEAPTSAAIATTTATLGGNVTSAGTAAVTERGVVYALLTANADPLIDGSGVTKATDAGATGVFTVPVTGLLPGKTYAFKAYATSAEGTTYTSVSTFTTLAPEIVVEQPSPNSLVSGVANIAFGARPLANASAAKTFTIRNNGTSVLTLTLPVVGGGNAGDFTVDGTGLLLTVPVAGQTTFSVVFTPGASGARSTTLSIGSDDLARPTFTVTLSGIGLVSSNDTDGDGLNDVAEFNYSSFGFDPLVAQPDRVATLLNGANEATLYTTAQFNASRTTGRNDVISSPNTYGLYSLPQIQALNINTPLIAHDASTGVFTLTLTLKKNTDLVNGTFQPFPFTVLGTSVNAAGEVEYRFTSSEQAAFYRLEAK